MVIVPKICQNCEFYDLMRYDANSGCCVLDHHTIEEPMTVSNTDSCDQWFQRSEDD